MKLFVPREDAGQETRVAISPDMVGRYVGIGFTVEVEKSAGARSRFTDATLAAAGAKMVDRHAVSTADIVLCVRRPSQALAKQCKAGALVLATMDPFGNEAEITELAKTKISAFAMELMPRITRAQSMDVLSSQANLAGYQAVLEAAVGYDRALPMMMTAAGTVPAAKIFVMGAGVAGLQAIATARRLGAVVTATDVRPAAKEQVESLGAKFIAVEDDEFRQAETAAGYAKEMSKEYQAKQAELVANHIAKQDIVITTALIPGRPAPRLINKAMVAAMPDGAVLVDLAVERGGNIEGSVADKTVQSGPASIIGIANMAGRVASTASLLYAKNLYAFVETMLDKETGKLALDWEDELVAATVLTRDGKIVNDKIKPVAAPKAAAASKPVAAPKAVAASKPKPAPGARKAASGAKKPTSPKTASTKTARAAPAAKRASKAEKSDE